MNKLALALVVTCSVLGCSDDAPTQVPSETGCGGATAAAGAECSSLAECGAGEQNFVRVQFCQHCFARADTHFCEAGKCRELSRTQTNVKFIFAVPDQARAAKSFTVASVSPLLADGTRTDCGALLAPECSIDGNGAINARNSRASALPAADVIPSEIAVDPGEGRMLFVQLTSDTQGKGAVLARGCATFDYPLVGPEDQVLIEFEGTTP